MTTLPKKDLLRPDEVACYLCVTRRTVYNWIKERKLKAVRIGRLLRIKHKSVIAFQKAEDPEC